MKKMSLFLILALLSSRSYSQVDVAATGGTANATYSTLKAAMDALNAGTHTGSITISITANTSEAAQPGAASVTLNASGSGSASYTSVTISPSGGGARTISGGATAGFPLLDLNGADNVTIDGLNSGGNSLTITNTMVAATTGTCTIRFINDATSNVIIRCTVRGASVLAGFREGSTIFFSTATATGNDNNTISNCDVGPVGSDMATKAICSIGTTTTAAHNNSGNTITDCNIFDFFSDGTESSGILLRQGNNDWTITNNKFYQTGARTHTLTNLTHSGIRLEATSFVNATVTGNTIGYASSSSTGTYTLVGVASSKFYPINVQSFGSTTANSIQNNTITAISFTGTMAGTGSSAPFIGIRIFEGKSNIGTSTGNLIGSTSSSSSISFSSSSTSNADLYGILYAGSIDNSVSNNSVGGISATNSSTGAMNVYGIRSNGGAAITTNIQSNTIGYTAAPISSSSSATSEIVGIFLNTGVANLTANTVRSLTIASNSSTINGIRITNAAATTGNMISQNTVSELSSTGADVAQVYGISYTGATSGTHVLSKNIVHSLTAATAGSTLYGVLTVSGLVTVQNNMVRLGINAAGNITTGLVINGLRDNSSSNNNVYFNSIYIGGSGVSGSANTFALVHSSGATTREIQNNILVNARTNGAGTGKHYIISVGGTGASPVGLTLNYNDYYFSGSGTLFGSYNGSDVTTLPNWKLADGAAGSGPGLDANSFFSDPQFVSPTSATPDLHVQFAGTPVEARGTAIGAITDDIDGQTRATLTPTDIGADAGNFVQTVLPVTFQSFNAKATAAANLLYWTTASESNNERFEVERSFDGIQFHRIGIITSKADYGNSTTPLHYDFADADKKAQLVFYRIRQVDFDGKSSYSPVLMLKPSINITGLSIRSIAPNPVISTAVLQIESSASFQVNVSIYDAAGKKINGRQLDLSSGLTLIPLDLSHLPIGWYVVQIDSGNQKRTSAFIKK